MEIAERPIDTPTLAMLKCKVIARGKHSYAFVLTDHDLTALRTAGMTLAAVAAYACIRGAVRAGWRHEWVTLRPRTIAAVGRDRRWWYEQTQRLERAGFINVQRRQGRLPRYQLSARSGDSCNAGAPELRRRAREWRVAELAQSARPLSGDTLTGRALSPLPKCEGRR